MKFPLVGFCSTLLSLYPFHMHGGGVYVLCINPYMNNLGETKYGLVVLCTKNVFNLEVRFKARVSGFNMIKGIFAQYGTDFTDIMPSEPSQDHGCYLYDD